MYPEIYKAMAAKNRMTTAELSRRTGIQKKTLSNKLNGKTDFKLCEMRMIQEVLGGKMDDLFYRQEIA